MEHIRNMQKFAIPVSSTNLLFAENPCSAPKFALFSVHRVYAKTVYALIGYVPNPWLDDNGNMMCSTDLEHSGCSEDVQSNKTHIGEHYLILEAIGGCDFLLAKTYCENTKRTLFNAGIKIYKLPHFISNIDIAIKNFLIGARIADSIKLINHAS